MSLPLPRWVRRLGTAGNRGHAPAGGPAREPMPSDAVKAERERIYSDLHDDIGARLLSILHSTNEPGVQELARQALHDLREVVYHARGEPATLRQVMAEIHAEQAERLALAGWTLLWEQEDMPDRVLPGERTIHLYRIVREATSNALKHGATHTLRVRARHVEDMVYVEITDLGQRWDVDGQAPMRGQGAGLASMQSRAARLGGQLELKAATLQGTKMLLRFPLSPGG